MNVDKKKLFENLSKLTNAQIKSLNLSSDDITYLKQRILNDKLGLVLNFEEKDEDLKNNYFGLEEVKELNINAKEKNNNLLIEGDNYYALKALQLSGIKVDVIYIDPPYNTGNRDFVYNDEFVDKDDQYKHSTWLTFMKKRLLLARDLLADDGVIFVSIDDNEQAYLKVLMDEIFGEENFVLNFIWNHKFGGGQDEKNFVIEHEYIMTYTKQEITNFKKQEIEISKNEYNKKYKEKDAKYVPLVKWGAGANDSFASLRYPIKDNEGNEYWPTKPDGSDGRWRKKPENCEHIIWQKNSKNINTPYEVIIKNDNFKFINFRSILLNNVVGTTANGTKLLKSILSTNCFSYPKPQTLIKFLINLLVNKNAVVLDFFAGSGTTAQAVMELNEEDEGNRRFILCTDEGKENNIARNICRERIYRVINGKGSKNKKIEWKYSDSKKSLSNNSMKYLKVKPINKFEGEYEEINEMEPLYKNEFNKDLSIKDFR